MPTNASLDVKPSRAAYPSWLRRKFKIDALAKGKAYYEIVASQLRDQTAASPFWLELKRAAADFDAEYRLATDFDLFVGPFPQLQVKGWERFLDKTYRINVQDNEHWPDAPIGGWLIPPDWFSRVKDVVRTLFVVKYLDGVDFLGLKIQETAAARGIDATPSLEFTELGYYAGHDVVSMQLDVPLQDWKIEKRDVYVEIQITTQIQEVIRRLLHPHYQSIQRNEVSVDIPWQWDYGSPQFSANYLGHILHYLEGQIMKVREEDS